MQWTVTIIITIYCIVEDIFYIRPLQCSDKMIVLIIAQQYLVFKEWYNFFISLS